MQKNSAGHGNTPSSRYYALSLDGYGIGFAQKP